MLTQVAVYLPIAAAAKPTPQMSKPRDCQSARPTSSGGGEGRGEEGTKTQSRASERVDATSTAYRVRNPRVFEKTNSVAQLLFPVPELTPISPKLVIPAYSPPNLVSHCSVLGINYRS